MKYIIIITIFIANIFAIQKHTTIYIKGMTCPLCTSAIKKSLKNTTGVIQAKVYLNTNTAKVIYDDKKVTTKQLLNAVKKVGYSSSIKDKGDY